MDTVQQLQKSRPMESAPTPGTSESSCFLQLTPAIEARPRISNSGPLSPVSPASSKSSFLKLTSDFRDLSTTLQPTSDARIQESILTHPEEVIDNTFAPAQPTSEHGRTDYKQNYEQDYENDYELDFPALPLPKPATPAQDPKYKQLTKDHRKISYAGAFKLGGPESFLRLIASDVRSNTVETPIGKLPTELQFMILQNLPTKDIKNVRRAVRSWYAASIEFLLRGHFSVRPNGECLPRIGSFDNLSKLEAVCRHALISKDIRLLTFNGYDMTHRMFFQYLRKQKGRSTRQQWEAAFYPRTEKMGKEGKRRINRPTQDDSERSMLEKILPDLPNLSKISIPSIVRLFREGDRVLKPGGPLDGVATEELRSIAFAIARRRCTAILLAANKLKCPLRSLRVEHLPLECFWTAESPTLARERLPEPYAALEGNETTRKTMSSVKDLQLGIGFDPETCSKYTQENWIFLTKEMGRWLGCFQSLRYLDLSISWEESLIFLNFMAEFQRVLSDITFPQLVHLRFHRFRLIQPEILPFILNHSSTLKYLGIGPCDCVPREQGDRGTKAFLTRIRDEMKKLERFFLVQNHDRENPEFDIYNTEDPWQWVPYPEHETKPISTAKLLEYYVLGACPWPLVPEGSPGTIQNKFMGTHNQFCNMSRQEQLDYFGKGWEAVVGEGLCLHSDSEIVSDVNPENEGADIGDVHFDVDPIALDLASLNHLLEMESRTWY